MESAEKLVERKDEQKQGISLPRTTFITCIGQVTKHGVPTCLQFKNTGVIANIFSILNLYL